MVYEGGTKGLVERKITPRALLQTAGRMYLTAYCHIDHMEKTYRLDRIREFRVEAP
jgi:predicted DNA-binding transcriptional regulator YafY